MPKAARCAARPARNGVVMGQATLELPDPMEELSPPSGVATTNADDLLAQLAGEEVDRLLREADVSREPADASSDALGHPLISAQLDNLFSRLEHSTIPVL